MSEPNRESFLQKIKEERGARLSYLDIPDDKAKEERTSMREEDIIAYLDQMASERPGYLETHEIIGTFENTGNKRQRTEACEQLATRFFEDPHLIDGVFSEIQRQSAFADEQSDIKFKSLAGAIESGLDKAITEGARKGELRFGPENTEVLRGWMESILTSPEMTKKLLEYWKRTVLATNDLRAFADGQYALADIAISSSTSEQVQLALNMYLGAIRGVFSEKEQMRLWDKNLAAWFDVSDDETLKKMLEVDGVFSTLLRDYAPSSGPRLQESLNDKLGTQIQSGEYTGSLYVENLKKFNADPLLRKRLEQRMDLNDALADRHEGKGPQSLDDPDAPNHLEYPYNLMFDPKEITPLRGKLNDYMQTRNPDARRMIRPDVGECVMKLPSEESERPAFIKEMFKGHEGEEYTNSRIFETLAAQFPNMGSKERTQMLDAVVQTRERLQYEARYLVSPRGDEIEITDPLLKDTYGISRIAFVPDSSVVDLKIKVTYLNGINCWCRLDANYVLRDMDTKKDVSVSADASLIWRDIFFSHLEQILCNREASSGGATESGSGEVGAHVRRPHKRKLGPGKGFTLQQAEIAMKDYGVDLHAYNRGLGLQKDQGQFTFVREGGLSFEEAQKLPPVVTQVGKVGAWQELFGK